MNGHMFAESIVLADFRASDSAAPFHVLGFQSEADERKNFVASAQGSVAVNDDVRVKPTIVTEHNMLADDAARADLAIPADLRFGMNDCGRMDHRIYDSGFTIYDSSNEPGFSFGVAAQKDHPSQPALQAPRRRLGDAASAA